MSHDFVFWETDDPLEDDEAREIYISLLETGASERARPSAKIAQLAEKINAQWPDPPSGKEDEWPLAAPIEVSDCHLVICIVPSRLWDVWPIVGGFAKELELVEFDPQQNAVFLPRRLSQKRTRVRAKKKQQQKPPET